MDFQDWVVTGDAITDSVWTVPVPLTVPAQSFTATSTTITVNGGTAGKIYKLVNRVTTNNGLVDERTLQLVCEQH